jgi:hypothetical protein
MPAIIRLQQNVKFHGPVGLNGRLMGRLLPTETARLARQIPVVQLGTHSRVIRPHQRRPIGFGAIEVINSDALQFDRMPPVRDWMALLNIMNAARPSKCRCPSRSSLGANPWSYRFVLGRNQP